MQVRRGGRDDAPLLMPYPVNDYGTGMMGACAVALALHERNRTGRGQSVDSGLALTAGLLQSPYFLDFAGHNRNEPEGRGLRGISAFSRLYQAADGWFYVHCADAEARGRLLALPQFSHLKSSPLLDSNGHSAPAQDGELSQEFAHIFNQESLDFWIPLFNGAGIAATANVGISDFRDDDHVRKAGLIVSREHPGQGNVDHLGNTAHLSGTPMRPGRPTPILGTDAEEILTEVGLVPEEIAMLKQKDVVVLPPGS